jgi:hypothetical protein
MVGHQRRKSSSEGLDSEQFIRVFLDIAGGCLRQDTARLQLTLQRLIFGSSAVSDICTWLAGSSDEFFPPAMSRQLPGASLCSSEEAVILLADSAAAAFMESVTINPWFFLKVNRLPW